MSEFWDDDDDVDSIDVIFEGTLVVLIPATTREIQLAPDGTFEVKLTSDVLEDVMDGDRIDATPAGAAIRELLRA